MTSLPSVLPQPILKTPSHEQVSMWLQTDTCRQMPTTRKGQLAELEVRSLVSQICQFGAITGGATAEEPTTGLSVPFFSSSAVA